MPSRGKQIKTGLDESRMIMLGSQVLLGAGYRSVFETAFPQLPPVSQELFIVSLGLLLVVVGLLVTPVAYDKICRQADHPADLASFISRMTDPALLPLAMALGLQLYVLIRKVVGPAAGLAAGVVGTAIALGFWYGLEAVAAAQKRRSNGGHALHPADHELAFHTTALDERITNVLTEGRVILPGAQALLGFQLIAVLTQGFERIPFVSRLVHLGSLGMVGLAIILLLTPPAYHRVVENGEDSERFYRFASRFVLASLVPLGLGLAGDFYVVTQKVTGSPGISAGAAGLSLLVLFGLWFGLTLVKRSRQSDLPVT